MDEIKTGSNRSFGIVFSVFFALLAIYFFYKFKNINYVIIFLSLSFLILGLLNSKVLTPLNILWLRFGLFLGKIVSPVIMAIVFFVVVTPLALLAKLVNKDFLGLDKKKNIKKNSYWIKKDKYKSSMKDQF